VKILVTIFYGVSWWVEADFSDRAAEFIFWDSIWGRDGVFLRDPTASSLSYESSHLRRL